ncbi:MAG: hypothetical protein ACYTXA_29410 [Nostoc sp.]
MPNTSLREAAPTASLRDPSLRDATRSLLPRSGTASSGHRATRTLSRSAQCPTPQLPDCQVFCLN